VERVERKDVEAAVGARRELGPAYDDEIVDALLAKIDQRLEERRARPPAQQHHLDLRLPIASIALGIGVTAVANSDAHGAGGVIISIIYWLAVAAINIAYARRF
jgi:hypothetical protein